MKNRNRISLRGISGALLCATLACHSVATFAAQTDYADEIPEIAAPSADFSERWDSGWTLRFDNDVFLGGSIDRDYSAGVMLTFRGRRVAESALSLGPARARLDRLSGFKRRYERAGSTTRWHALQIGLLLFTPDDITTNQPDYDDRPFANLLYLAGSQISINGNASKAYQSTLTLGLLGSDVGQKLQNVVHSVTGSADANGWRNQISDGGELTARYAIARHSLLSSGYLGRRGFDLKLTIEGSVGYLTEGSAGLALRWGRLRSPWWASTVDYSGYASQPSPQRLRPHLLTREKAWYVSSGIRLRARAHNVFLQGQFRDSPVTFSASELRHVLLEGWLGYTADVGNANIQYALHYQSAEIRYGRGARDLIWAGITVSRSF